MPFQLERLKYNSVSALTGWLLCAYVRLLSHLPTLPHTTPKVRWAGPLYVPRPLLSHLLPSLFVSHNTHRNLRGKESLQAYSPRLGSLCSPSCSSPPYGSTQLRCHGDRTYPPGYQFFHGLGCWLGPPVAPFPLSTTLFSSSP